MTRKLFWRFAFFPIYIYSVSMAATRELSIRLMGSLWRDIAEKWKAKAANEWRLWKNKLHFEKPHIWRGHRKLMVSVSLKIRLRIFVLK